MLDAIFRIFALTRKELLAVLKDPRSRFSLIIPPILQCLIYGYVATYDLNDVPYAVLDQDRSAASQKLLSGLDGSGVFRRVGNLNRAAEIKTASPQPLLSDRRRRGFAWRVEEGNRRHADRHFVPNGLDS